MAHEPPSTPAVAPDPGRGGRIAWAFLALLAPFMLVWTSWNFWRLATTGKLWVRDGTSVFETDGGIHFWITLGLYGVFWIASVALIGVAIARLRSRTRR